MKKVIELVNIIPSLCFISAKDMKNLTKIIKYGANGRESSSVLVIVDKLENVVDYCIFSYTEKLNVWCEFYNEKSF